MLSSLRSPTKRLLADVDSWILGAFIGIDPGNRVESQAHQRFGRFSAKWQAVLVRERHFTSVAPSRACLVRCWRFVDAIPRPMVTRLSSLSGFVRVIHD